MTMSAGVVRAAPCLPLLLSARGDEVGKLCITFLRPPERSPFRPALLLYLLRIFRAIHWYTSICGLVDESFGPARALRDVWTANG